VDGRSLCAASRRWPCAAGGVREDAPGGRRQVGSAGSEEASGCAPGSGCVDGGLVRLALDGPGGGASAQAGDHLVLPVDTAAAHRAGAGRYPVRRLTPTHVRALLAAKSTRASRCGQCRSSTRRWGHVGRGDARRGGPAERRRSCAGADRRAAGVQPWSPEDAGAFLKAARADRLYALFAVGVGLGIRRRVLLGLRWSDGPGGWCMYGTRRSGCAGTRWCSGGRSRCGRVGHSAAGGEVTVLRSTECTRRKGGRQPSHTGRDRSGVHDDCLDGDPSRGTWLGRWTPWSPTPGVRVHDMRHPQLGITMNL
jgi:integrase